MKHPFFSVIIPTYNRADFLKICIDSVINQIFDSFELIIVDDGSSDNTKNIVNRFNDTRINYIYQEHNGVSSARNRGLKSARSEFICFLDSDDRFRREKLSITYEYIQNNPRYHIFHTEELWYRSGAYLPQKKNHQKPCGRVFTQAIKLCCVSISTVALKKQIFDEIGFFDETLPACEDYDFWLRTTSRYPVMLIPQYLTIKEGGHPDQQSKKYPAMDQFRIYSLKKILESGDLTAEYFSAAIEELINKCSIYITGSLKRGKFQEAAYYQQILDRFKNSKNHVGKS